MFEMVPCRNESVVGLVSEPDRERRKFCAVWVMFLEVRDDLEYLLRHDLGYLSIRDI